MKDDPYRFTREDQATLAHAFAAEVSALVELHGVELKDFGFQVGFAVGFRRESDGELIRNATTFSFDSESEVEQRTTRAFYDAFGSRDAFLDWLVHDAVGKLIGWAMWVKATDKGGRQSQGS